MRVKCISRFFYSDEGRYVDPPEELELEDELAKRLTKAGCVVEVKPKRKAGRPKADKAVRPREDK